MPTPRMKGPPCKSCPRLLALLVGLSSWVGRRAARPFSERRPAKLGWPDTLMQDRSPLTRRNLLATHGRTIHLGHQRRIGPFHNRSALLPNSRRRSGHLKPTVSAKTGREQLRRGSRYSITSSARASSVGGTSMPSTLAVLRLMTNSNLVGSCTGRSEGVAPFSILSTYWAARR